MEARILPKGSKDKDKQMLKIDSSKCLPTEIEILSSIVNMMSGLWQKFVLVVPFSKLEKLNAMFMSCPLREPPKIILLTFTSPYLWPAICQREMARVQ